MHEGSVPLIFWEVKAPIHSVLGKRKPQALKIQVVDMDEEGVAAI